MLIKNYQMSKKSIKVIEITLLSIKSAPEQAILYYLIQPPFDYACIARFQNLFKKLRLKLQVTPSKCIRLCLQLLVKMSS